MKSRKPSAGNAGFTLIEVAFVVAILVSLTGLGLWASLGFYRTYALNAEVDIVASLLARARSYAMNNVNQSAHGLYFGGGEYVLFRGSSYAVRDTRYDEKTPRAYAVDVSGLAEAVFAPLTGEVGSPGDIVLSDRQRSVTISVNNEGRIAW